MKDLVFRLPGDQGGLFFERLKWKIYPLIAVLLQRGYSVECVPASARVQADVNIWIINETMPPIENDQKNLLWYCHRMEILSWVELHSFDGILTTSHSHSLYLKHLFKSEKPITYLPWPIDLNKIAPDLSTDTIADWVVMWNAHRSHKVLECEKWVVANSHRFQIFGQRWDQYMDDDFPNLPVGETFASHILGAPAYWSIDLLRNRISGFVDSFPLYALAQGKRVYSETIYDLPNALDQLITMVDFDTPETQKTLMETPVPLTPRECERAHQYLGHHHHPDRLADRFERILGRLRDDSFHVHIPKSLAAQTEIHLYQDFKSSTDANDVFENAASIEEAATLMAQDRGHTLVFHPTAADWMPENERDVSQEVHLQHIALGRLKAAMVALRYTDRLKIAAPTAPNPIPAPLHDFTNLLFRIEHWTQGGTAQGLLADLEPIINKLPLHSNLDAEKVSEFGEMWQRVTAATWDPHRNAQFISAHVNNFNLVLSRTDRFLPDRYPLQHAEHINQQRCAVFAHIFYPELAPKMLESITNIPVDFKLYIGTTDAEKAQLIQDCLPDALKHITEIRIFENKGRDIYSKFFGFRDVYKDIDICLHIHSKKSPHSGSLQSWRDNSLNTLLGTPDQVQGILSTFAKDPNIGLICPEIPSEIAPGMNWMRNWQIATYLNKSLGFDLPDPGKPFEFPAGSMFWARTELLRPIIDLELTAQDFPQEEGQQDGTVAHAIERLIGICIRQQNKKIAFIGQPESHQDG